MKKIHFHILLTFFAVHISFSGGQVIANNEDDLSTNCECTPSCKPITDCKESNISVRKDCPCCKVCLRSEGEECEDIPCDEGKNLSCSPKGKCEVVLPCKIDGDCSDDRFCVRNMCTDPCPMLQPCQRRKLKGASCVTREHQPRCECPLGTFENMDLQMCIEKEDGFQPSIFHGEKEKHSKPPLKNVLTVLSLSPNTTSLNLPSSAGGVLHYKESLSNFESLRKVVQEGKSRLTVGGLNPGTKYTFKWAGSDGSTSKVEIKTEDGCVHDNQTFAIGAKWHEGCQTTCMCLTGGISDCRPRCVFVAGSIQDDQCTEIPSSSDPDCCVEYDCKEKDNSLLNSSSSASTSTQSQEREPKLIVTARGHNSITVAWDDFSAGNPERRYVTEYRQVPAEQIDTKIPWMRKETDKGQPPPTMTLGQLKPNTLYEVRVGIYSQSEERQLIAATETITARTEAGCVYGNTSFPVGTFFQGCEERCTCNEDGAVKCTGRCTIPYFKKGSFADDPLCTEESEVGDECCVLVMCAHGGGEGIEDYDQCANTVCGKNAVCVAWPTLTEASHGDDLPQPGSCRCKEGFKGDPTDHTVGCVSDPSTFNDSSKCTFRLKSYGPGERFNDGCLSKCVCSQHGEIECQPRCQFGLNDTNSSSVDSSCSLIPDPNDDCCQIQVCNSSVQKDGAPVPSAPLDFDGCIHENITYSRNKEFMLGCDSRCLCMGYGDISCSPRCPPLKEFPKEEGVICNTLIDPDDECCNVTVCDKYPQDVMKAASNGTEERVPSLNVTRTSNFTGKLEGRSSFSFAEGVEPKAFSDALNFSDNAPLIFPEKVSNKSLNESSNNVEFAPTTESRVNNSDEAALKITQIEPLDSSIVKVTVTVSEEILSQLLSSASENIIASYSHDSLTWTNKTISVDDIDVQNMYEVSFILRDLEAHDAYQFRVFYRQFRSPVLKASLIKESAGIELPSTPEEAMCTFKNKRYRQLESFYNDCEEFCLCSENGTVQCNKIECPSHFGLDLMNPGCLEWEDDPNLSPTPPRCCGTMPKCVLHIDHLSCEHMGQKFDHLDFIPKEFVGCDKRCQCLSGNLDCESLCGPVAAIPPFHLPCAREQVRLVTASTFPCCKEWLCLNDSVSEGDHPEDHTNIHIVDPPISLPEAELTFLGLNGTTDSSVRILFSIARIFVGLPGGIYLRYTDNIGGNPNPLNWNSEIIHEDGVIMNQAEWEYVKRGLKSSTDYSMQLVLSTHLKKNETTTPIFHVSTLREVSTPIPLLELNAKIYVSDVQNTSAKISWKRFTDFELKYIDGLRVRYWQGDKKIPLEGPMLHRDASSIFLRNLLPDTKYTIDLFFIPKEGLQTSISNTKNFTFTTLPKAEDKYAFDLTIRSGKVSHEGVQVLYSGVPTPEGKFVNVFRVIYTSDGDKHDSEKFSVPRTNKDGVITISNMKPGVAYEVWMEAYLTNGIKKKSNVITVRTHPGQLPKPEKSEINESFSGQQKNASTYYSAFVAMLIMTLLATIVAVGLAALLFRRKNNLKTSINTKTASAAYDNPSYKTSENQANYAIELNGLRSSSGRTD